MHDAAAEARMAWQEAPSAEPVDTAALVEELTQAGITNREIDKAARRRDLMKQQQDLVREVNATTRRMEGRDEKKLGLVSGAKMPIEGLAIVEGKVLYNGIPVKQLGEAKQILLSIRIVLARSPRLRLVRIDRGEALDKAGMEELYRLAEELDFTAMVARVDETGTVGIFLEDGEVKAVNE
jgi:hypothetical protein